MVQISPVSVGKLDRMFLIVCESIKKNSEGKFCHSAQNPAVHIVSFIMFIDP